MHIRFGTCKECKEKHHTKSNFQFIANLKYNEWLYRHYKEAHKTNVITQYIKLLIRRHVLKLMLSEVQKNNPNRVYKILWIHKHINREEYFQLKREYLDYFYYNGDKVLTESLEKMIIS